MTNLIKLSTLKGKRRKEFDKKYGKKTIDLFSRWECWASKYGEPQLSPSVQMFEKVLNKLEQND